MAPQTSFAADALLSLLHPAWQTLIAGCLLIVTILGLGRLMKRGPARMTNAVVITGLLIVIVTVIGSLAVSCSGAGAEPAGSAARTRSLR